MQTYDLKNPYCAKGWEDWILSYPGAAAKTKLVAVDGLTYGLVTNRDNPVGFPTAGKSYMLLARQINDGAGATTECLLSTSQSYTFTAGDIVACDLGWQNNSTGAGVGTFTGRAYVGATGLATLNLNLHTHKIINRIYWRVTAALSGALKIQVIHAKTGGGNFIIDWLSVDNIMVFPSNDYLDDSEAFDASGVL